ncbi:MAG TPA: hypothetical protein VGO88_08825 [Mycetocola sp.]|jgi:hypothetical protein|uniref:hypothetical protein n=1 Tax=Mycetocola sp. TaxID=1871042 RepID=UPI002606B1DD|nr:hypothetical protein [Mycetocola sp.]MCU1560207.1 Ribose/xylose/arabinose/galactoside ABC-type transport system, permease component [Mycetocola sp.]HEV7849409.1 hypothetical protein [Mycetocola sp.]
MPRNTLIVGGVLIVLGVISYIASAFASWTALIPSILGAVLVVCGLLALTKPKLGIHIALVVALLGLAGTLMNVLKLGEVFAGTAERPLAVIVSAITFVLLLIYIVLGVRSFIAARRWRNPDAASQV